MKHQLNLDVVLSPYLLAVYLDKLSIQLG